MPVTLQTKHFSIGFVLFHFTPGLHSPITLHVFIPLFPLMCNYCV
jgi:hypothetical protein